MDCPKCGGPAYDNRERIADGWKGPLAKCKDQDGCGWKKWPPKNKGGANAGPAAAAPTQPRPQIILDSCLDACVAAAREIANKQFPRMASQVAGIAGGLTDELIINLAVTLYISRTRDRSGILKSEKEGVAKRQAAEAERKRKEEDERRRAMPAPAQDDDFPGALDEPDDDLPF